MEMEMDLVHDRATDTPEEEEDRISNLPDDIIHRILSFIDMKYAIQTSSLSKKWKYVWTTMPYLKFDTRMFRTMAQFIKFMKHALSHRNHRTEVFAAELKFRGGFNQFVAKSIVNYAYSHNLKQLTIIWSGLSLKPHELPQSLFSSHTLKHLNLTLANGYRMYAPKLAWDFPALETLNLSNLEFGDNVVKSLDLFSKCVNLKDLKLHKCDMRGMDIFNVCVPRLSNLTITDTIRFPKVFKVVAPQLENLTASVCNWSSSFLQLSTEDLNSLEEVNLSMPPSHGEKERYAPGLQDLFQKLCGAKFLILDKGIIEVLSACLDQLSHQSCPFNNLKFLKIDKQKNRTASVVPDQVRNYFLESSPSVTFIMDLPQVPKKRSREEADKGTMAKKVGKLEKEKQQPETMAKKALSSCTSQLSHEPSPFSKCLNQTECIPRISTEVKNQLLESSPSATFNKDLPQVDNGTTANTLEEEKHQTKTVDEEKRMLEAKISMQDELIVEQKAMLEAMKVQHEKRMLEAKIHVQDKIIARQKAMLELLHENGMLEEKMVIHDETIAEQKAMLETMKLQNEKRMFEAKIQRQKKTISQQKAMLEAMKLQNEKIETELVNIDS